MSNILLELTEKKIAHPPSWLAHNTHYLTMMGSVAYGVSSDTSDCDVYGFCIPAKDEVFPHLRGEIIGFGTQKHRFAQYQEHHLMDEHALAGKGREYDLSVYNIVDYFQLVTKNNPNMIDSLFTPDFCVLHITRIGTMVRENRRMFLHKGCWHTFKGYAYAQMKKLGNKHRESSKRQEMVEKYGMDLKYAYHIVRLLNEVEQIMTENDLDLLRNREQLKAIRRGDWTGEQIQEYFTKKETDLETVYANSELPWGPDEQAIKSLLLRCLEEHYGSLQKCIVNLDKQSVALQQIRAILDGLSY